MRGPPPSPHQVTASAQQELRKPATAKSLANPSAPPRAGAERKGLQENAASRAWLRSRPPPHAGAGGEIRGGGESSGCHPPLASSPPGYLPIFHLPSSSIHLAVHPSICPSIRASTHQPFPPPIHPSVHPSIYLSICLFIHPRIRLSICRATYRSVPPTIYPSPASHLFPPLPSRVFPLSPSFPMLLSAYVGASATASLSRSIALVSLPQPSSPPP